MRLKIGVRQYEDGRWGFDDYSRGRRKRIRLKSKTDAQNLADDLRVLIANGRRDLLAITPLELAEFREWKKSAQNSESLTNAIDRLLALKQNKSGRHLQSLTRDLNLFRSWIDGQTPIASITAPAIQDFLNSRAAGDRRKFNLRATIVALFRFARRQGYLPDRTTEAEKVEPIERAAGTVNILSPAELLTLIENVREEFLPWLLIGAFAGVRSEEIAPDRQSKKSPLKWEDFNWRHKIIRLSEKTAKTRHARDIPIVPNLALWLAPLRNSAGPICLRQPTHHETKRLGEFIGGWRNNCLRDSFCSYRTRITQNMAQTSLEMGNSVAMVKRSYHETQPVRIAREWFNIQPPGRLPRHQKKCQKVPKI